MSLADTLTAARATPPHGVRAMTPKHVAAMNEIAATWNTDRAARGLQALSLDLVLTLILNTVRKDVCT
jgi:hypothetical protein